MSTSKGHYIFGSLLRCQQNNPTNNMTLQNKIWHKINHNRKGAVRHHHHCALLTHNFINYSRWANWIKKAWDTEGHTVLSLPRQLNEQSPMLTQAEQRSLAKLWWCSIFQSEEGERVLVKSRGLRTVLRLHVWANPFPPTLLPQPLK